MTHRDGCPPLEAGEEVLGQVVPQVGRELAAAVDAEGGGQGGAQGLHEPLPLPLRHNVLPLVVLLKRCAHTSSGPLFCM